MPKGIKEIRIILTEDEYNTLQKVKDGLTWHDYLLKDTNKKQKEK